MRRVRWLLMATLVTGAIVAIPYGVDRAKAATSGATSAALTSSPPSARSDPAARNMWSTFVALDHAFRVTGPPDPVTRSVDSELGPAHEVTFDQGAFSVAWLDRSSGQPDGQLLQTEVSRMLQPLVGLTADEEHLSDAGHPGFGLSFSANGTHFRVRVFAAGGRLFEIVAKAPAGSPTVGEAEAFVDSFRLG